MRFPTGLLLIAAATFALADSKPQSEEAAKQSVRAVLDKQVAA